MKRPLAVKRFYSPINYLRWVEDQHHILERARFFGCSNQCWLHHALMVTAWILEVHEDYKYWLNFQTDIGV